MERKKHLSQEQREAIVKRATQLIKEGYVMRGGTKRPNALVQACAELEIEPVHWALVNIWLRQSCKHLRADYKKAQQYKKECNRAQAVAKKEK